MRQSLHALWDTLFGSVKDLAPIALVIAFFQLVALQQPLPDLLDMLLGVLLVVPGPTAFVYGLDGPVSRRREHGGRSFTDTVLHGLVAGAGDA